MSEILFPQIDLGDIKGVLIDIDNTLYAYGPSHQKAIVACHEAFSAGLSLGSFSKRYRQKRNEVIERLGPQGICRSRLLAFQSLFEEMQIPQAFHKAWESETVYWNTFIGSIELCHGARALLLKCQKEGIKTCALSDMQTHFQVRKLEALGVDEMIDFLVTSEETGSEKPAPIMFRSALKKLELGPEEVVMVGDNEKKDIEGAQALGIRGFLVTCSI